MSHLKEKFSQGPDYRLRDLPAFDMTGENEPVIVEYARTGVGKLMGSLASFSAVDLGTMAVQEVLKKAGVDPELVDLNIMGLVLSSAVGQNPARQVSVRAGLAHSVESLTINQVCASGLQSVVLGAKAICVGDASVAVCGGMESMSQAPHLLTQMRQGARLGHSKALDSMIHDGLWCATHDLHMGCTGELVAHHYGISREEQDRYALESHQKAAKAQKEGVFAKEIFTVEIPQRKGEPIRFDLDESVRPGTTLEKLAKLRPAFEKGGTVTAGNAPGVNDGGSAVLVMSRKKAKELGLKIKARILGYATGGLDPAWVMMTPVAAVRQLLARLPQYKLEDYDLFEVNEAFSVQALAVTKELGLDSEKVNVFGGSVALGHPIGASGNRIFCTLLNALETKEKSRGIATLCLGGGNGVAVAIEREQNA